MDDSETDIFEYIFFWGGGRYKSINNLKFLRHANFVSNCVKAICLVFHIYLHSTLGKVYGMK